MHSSVPFRHLLAYHVGSEDLCAPTGQGLSLPQPYVSGNCLTDDKDLMSTFKRVKEEGRKERKKGRKGADFPGPVLSSR